jgi:O-antigen/teichoic acid export membrane protein
MIEMAFNAAFLPAMAYSLAAGRGEELRALFLRVSRTALAICLPLVLMLMLFPARVMAVIGEQFIEAAPVVSLVTLGTLVSFSAGPVASALAMAGRTRTQLVNGLIAGGTGLALNLVLIPYIGIIGAGIAQSVSMILSNALNARSVWRLLRVVGIGRDHIPLLVASLSAAGAGFLADRFAPTNKYGALAMVSISLAAAYIAGLAVAGIAAEDRQLMRSLLARIRMRAGTGNQGPGFSEEDPSS